MGNCQAAEAATVLIQHPAENKVERIYCSVTAQQVMSSNPGHYVALLINSSTGRTHNGVPVKQLKLLRPDDTLLLGHVYRLVSFQEVLKEFAAKKSVKLGKLIKENGGLPLDARKKTIRPPPTQNFKSRSAKGNSVKNTQEMTSQAGSSRGVGRHHGGGGGGGQWKPALQSIAEVGT